MTDETPAALTAEEERELRSWVRYHPPSNAQWFARLLATLDAARARSVPDDGLDVGRLAWALHGWRQCDFGYCEGADDHMADAEVIAAEYAALSASPTETP